jgi:hypothetical protein
MTTDSRLPGWYPDPQHDRLERWWDGHSWTATIRPLLRTRVPGAAAAREPRAPMSTDAKRALLIAAVAIALFTVWGYNSVVYGTPTPTSATVSEPTTVS